MNKYKELFEEYSQVSEIANIEDDRRTNIIVEKIESMLVDSYHKNVFISFHDILKNLTSKTEEQEIKDIIDYTIGCLGDFHLLEVKQAGIEGNTFKITKKGLIFLGYDSQNIIVMSMVYFLTAVIILGFSIGYLQLNILAIASITVVYSILGIMIHLNSNNRIIKLTEN